jgi:hypothetical protein
VEGFYPLLLDAHPFITDFVLVAIGQLCDVLLYLVLAAINVDAGVGFLVECSIMYQSHNF